MNVRASALLLAFGLAFSSVAMAKEIIVATPDGKKVRLKEDQTWEYVKKADAAAADASLEQLIMTVERVISKTKSCKLGLRLSNQSNYLVTSIVPRFSAMLGGGKIKYETVSVEFSRIKPLRYEYKEIKFVGLGCSEIDFVRVHGGDRCTMGDLDKFGATKGECIGRVKVMGAGKFDLRKEY